jgi:hypothetical protein
VDNVTALRDEINVSSSVRRIINENDAVMAIDGDVSVTSVNDAMSSSLPQSVRVTPVNPARAAAYEPPPMRDAALGRHIDIYV